MEKDFRGKKLYIEVQNPDGKESGVKSIVLNGTTIEGDYIAADLLQDENQIVVQM